MEPVVDHVPQTLKNCYVWIMQSTKGFLSFIHVLPLLDKLARKHQRFHYLRSLLAIYQLDDMIALDVPWWTYSAIAAIDQHIKKLDYKPAVFEYGSGASTIWLARRCDRVISVEHDKIWYQRLKNKIAGISQVKLILQEPEKDQTDKKYRSKKMPRASFKSYVKAIEQSDQLYDLIIIDGRSREACLETCLSFLKPNGIIVFDNSDRKRYQPAIQASTLMVHRYAGIVPGSPFKSETAILTRNVASA
jgi:hypothetical protein